MHTFGNPGFSQVLSAPTSVISQLSFEFVSVRSVGVVTMQRQGGEDTALGKKQCVHILPGHAQHVKFLNFMDGARRFASRYN